MSEGVCAVFQGDCERQGEAAEQLGGRHLAALRGGHPPVLHNRHRHLAACRGRQSPLPAAHLRALGRLRQHPPLPPGESSPSAVRVADNPPDTHAHGWAIAPGMCILRL